MLVSVSEAMYTLAYPASHFIAHYPISLKIKLAVLLLLQEVPIQADYIFIGRRYFQLEECVWRQHHSLEYHNNLIPSTYDLKDAIAFGYRARLFTVSQPAPRSGIKGVE